MSIYLDKLRKILTNELISKGFYLREIGVNNYAWNSKDAINVIETLYKNNILILGGDVYKFENNKFVLMLESWYIKKASLFPTKDELDESKSISINFINNLTKKHGDLYYYSIVASIQ